MTAKVPMTTDEEVARHAALLAKVRSRTPEKTEGAPVARDEQDMQVPWRIDLTTRLLPGGRWWKLLVVPRLRPYKRTLSYGCVDRWWFGPFVVARLRLTPPEGRGGHRRKGRKGTPDPG